MKKIFLLLLTCTTLNAQSIGDTLHNNRRVAYVETGIMAATGKNMPFWLRSNQYGIVTPNANALATVRGGYYYNHDLGKKGKADWGIGINAVANISNFNQPLGISNSSNPIPVPKSLNPSMQTELLLPEAYARIRYKWFDFFAGRKREIYGLVDSTLSSGSYIWSGNALPMPKIQVGWTDYKPILGKGFISLKGSFAHGWFGDQTSVENYYLHQKTLYGRIGRANAKVQFFAGFNHQVQWGGSVKFKNSETVAVDGKFPSDGTALLLATTGLSLIRLSQWGLVDQSKYAYNDAFNRIGNHLGTIDLGMTINTKNTTINFYRQNIYDDGSLFYLANIEDGLNGISLNLKQSKTIKRITVEYLQTSDQGVSSNKKNPTDNEHYFNHSGYRDGWSYGSFGIGTPFIEPNPSFNRKIIGSDTAIFTKNNKVEVFHLGFRAVIKSVSFDFKGSLVSSMGAPGYLKNTSYGYYYLFVSKPIKTLKRNYLIECKFASDSFKSLGSSLVLHFPL